MRTPWWLLFACLLVAVGCSDSMHPTAVQTSSLDQAAVPAAVPPAAGVQGEFWPGEPPPLHPAEFFYDPASEQDSFAFPAMSVADFREQQVIRNAWIVKAAVEAWSAESGDRIPACLASLSPLGNTLIDFLPDGHLMINPFMLLCDTPASGPVHVPGSVGYWILDVDHDGEPDVYYIQGQGKHCIQICLLIGP
jgi:hypothetical protein